MGYLIWFGALAELRSESNRTYAGFLWWLLEPLLLLVVYYVVFKLIFHNPMENFALFLFSGIVVWRWFNSAVMRSAASLINSRGLIQVVKIPKEFFPLKIVIVDCVKFLFTLLAVILVASAAGVLPGSAYLCLPLLIILQLFLISGSCLVVAALVPFMPDLQMVLTTGLLLLMFLSGIFYSIDAITGPIHTLIRLNPMALLIEQYRQVLLSNQMTSLASLGYIALTALLLNLLGISLLRRWDKHYPKLSC